MDEDEEVQEATDRAYWEAKGLTSTKAIADEMLKLVAEYALGLELEYNRFYIGLASNGRPNNLVQFRPQKNALRVAIRLQQTQEAEDEIEAFGFDVLDYEKRWGRYRFRLAKGGEGET